jgi:ribosomal protein S18 acetylase RimI-like enzyme
MTATDDLLLFARAVGQRQRAVDELLGSVELRPTDERWELRELGGEDDSSPVAAAATRRSGDSAELVAFAVAEERRRVGLATRLLREVAGALCAGGCRTFCANVRTDAGIAIAVLNEAGFQPTHVSYPSGGSRLLCFSQSL